MYDTETVIRLNQALRQDIRHSQLRTLVMLFLSSFIVYYWFGMVFDVLYKGIGMYPLMRLYTGIPPLLNALSWLAWGALNYLTFSRDSLQKKFSDADREDLIEAHHKTSYQYYRQTRIEHLIILFAAFQMFFVAALSIYLVIRFGG